MRWSKTLLLCIMFAFGNLWALGDDTALSQLMLDNWTSTHGLPQNSVLTMIQTRNGYLWMGTE